MADAILLLCGGEARRFPGKLERMVAGKALVLRVFERLREYGVPLYLAGKGTFAAEIDAALDAPLIVDRRPAAGPLHALLTAAPFVRADRIFAVAADQPQIGALTLGALTRAWEHGDEAVVPRHAGGIEPLAALYERRALLRVGPRLRREGRSAMHDLVGCLATRFLPQERRHFANVNVPRDLPRTAVSS